VVRPDRWKIYQRTKNLPYQEHFDSFQPDGPLPFPAANLVFSGYRPLKSSPPQMLAQGKEMKAGIFPGKVIIVAGGKVSVLSKSKLSPLSAQ
jgi:hypothetical protein